MNNVICYKAYERLPVNVNEVLRYAGDKSPQNENLELLQQCIATWQGQDAANRVCYTVLPLTITGEQCDFGVFKATSRSLAEHLCGCSRAVVFAATIGIGLDRLIARYASVSPVRALYFQAIGAQQIEALCNAFCADLITQTQKVATKRFSPGYGDLPLQLQKEIFLHLNCPKQIGVTLNSSLLMSPTKSVTAIVGLK